jgi:hypothetical protein
MSVPPMLTGPQMRAVNAIVRAAKESAEEAGGRGPDASDISFLNWGAGIAVVRRISWLQSEDPVALHVVVMPDGASRPIYDKAERRRWEEIGVRFEKARIKRGYFFKEQEQWVPAPRTRRVSAGAVAPGTF